MQIITVTDMLTQMATGESFSIAYYTYDRKRKTGGELRIYHEAELMRPNKKKKKAISRQPTQLEAAQQVKTKRPNHSHFYTRNIRILENGNQTTMIRKIHPLLVDQFDGKTVTL